MNWLKWNRNVFHSHLKVWRDNLGLLWWLRVLGPVASTALLSCHYQHVTFIFCPVWMLQPPASCLCSSLWKGRKGTRVRTFTLSLKAWPRNCIHHFSVLLLRVGSEGHTYRWRRWGNVVFIRDILCSAKTCVINCERGKQRLGKKNQFLLHLIL